MRRQTPARTLGSKLTAMGRAGRLWLIYKFSGKQWTELQDPSPHRFIGDIQTALSEQVFDVAIAEGETRVESGRAG
jgi:hypothetical protein